MFEVRNRVAFEDHLDSLLRMTESDDLEFKSAAGGLNGYWLLMDGYVTNESLRIVLGIHKAEIADLLKDMCKNNLLVQEGDGRGTKYYLPKDGSNILSSESNIPSNIASIKDNDEDKDKS